jgi:hypothetical protein
MCFNWAPRHEGVLGSGGIDSLIPRERSPCTHWIGSWVGPRAVLDAVVKRKIPSPHQESNPRTPIVQPVAQRYTDWTITALDVSLSCCVNKCRNTKVTREEKGHFLEKEMRPGSGPATDSCEHGNELLNQWDESLTNWWTLSCSKNFPRLPWSLMVS